MTFLVCGIGGIPRSLLLVLEKGLNGTREKGVALFLKVPYFCDMFYFLSQLQSFVKLYRHPHPRESMLALVVHAGSMLMIDFWRRHTRVNSSLLAVIWVKMGK